MAFGRAERRDGLKCSLGVHRRGAAAGDFENEHFHESCGRKHLNPRIGFRHWEYVVYQSGL